MTLPPRLRLVAVPLAWALCAVSALSAAPFGPPAPKAEFAAEVVPDEVRRGETVELRISVDVEEGWHLYSPKTYDSDLAPVPTKASLPEDSPFRQVGGLTGPEPEKKLDPGFGFEIEYYPGDVDLVLRLRVPDDAELGETEVQATIEYMACSDIACTPPTTAEVTASARVVSGNARPEYVAEPGEGAQSGADAPKPAPVASSQGEIADKGFWGFAWLAITMGCFALLTPCVFPMIPITVSFFTSQEGRTRGQALGMAATYASGIVVTYTLIGVILAATLGAAGANQLAASPGFNLFVTVLFGAFALSMFGLFEMRLPSSFVQFSTKQQGRGGLLGTLFMSLTFALVSFSCTSAFVGVLLVHAAQGEWIRPIVGMALFSGTLAVPFFFLALFPRLLESLPKSGEWMEAVKVVMGFLLVAVATKFLSNADAVWGWGVLTRPVVLAVWVCSFGLAGAYLLGKIQLVGHGASAGVGPFRLVVSLLFLTLAIYLCAGLAGRPLHGWLNAYLPLAEEDAFAGGSATDTHAWLSDYDAALEEATRTGKPVFLDFSGYTCTNCRWMETNIFPQPEVSALLDEYVLVKLMTDRGEGAKANRELQEETFGTVELPLYIVVSPEGEEVARKGMTRDAEAFAAFLKSALSTTDADPEPEQAEDA